MIHDVRKEVDRMIESGTSFDCIESYIEHRRDLSADAKSALWLLAWVETSADSRRVAVDELLALHD